MRGWVAGAALCALGMAAVPALAEVRCHGASLPDNSKRVKDAAKDECRFISSLNWDETMKFLGRNTSSSGTRWQREVNIPQVKYRTLENTAPKSGWEAMNVYMLGQGEGAGEVRIYVVPRPAEPVAAPKGKKKKGK
jgi:hypothetical protein